VSRVRTIVVVGALALMQLAGAAPASAVPGLHMVPRASGYDSGEPKTVKAHCPTGERVIGGGGFIAEHPDDIFLFGRPVLTELRPVFLEDGTRDSYVATGAESPGVISGRWAIAAYAMCADPLTGLHIVSNTTAPATTDAQATAAVCPRHERVIGTGASVSALRGNVSLQVARPSKPGDIARARAHEQVGGFLGRWHLTAQAVCAPRSALDGYEVVFTASPEQDSQREKEAFAPCGAGRQLHSAGAAITNLAPASVSLQGIFPDDRNRRTQALAVENVPTGSDWDFIVASAICAS
jgi:hypothetical protein